MSLPWKSEEERSKLLNNEKMARSRLDQLTHRLNSDPQLKNKYHGMFSEMHNEGILEEVPESEICCSHSMFYLPHQPVVKESSLTTNVRPVFDASAKGFNGVSLNDCLETGPNMMPDLPAILLHFKRWRIALSADVTKAFIQIRVSRQYRNVHRFLWDDHGVVRRMRCVRLPFGNKSSPFLLNATIKHHLSQCPHSRVIEVLSENMYVDDWLSGCDDDADGCAMLREADDAMGQAGMSLAKWGSNSEQVLLCREFQDFAGQSSKVLGIRWLANQDCFSFDGATMPRYLVYTYMCSFRMERVSHRW